MSEENHMMSCPFCGAVKGKGLELIVHADGLKEVAHRNGRCAIGNKFIHLDQWNTRASGWIKVSERLPEPGTRCLTASPNWQMFAISDRCGNWWTDSVNGKQIWPTHWQPMPEPPSKEET